MAAEDDYHGQLFPDDVTTIRPRQLLASKPLYLALQALVDGRPGSIVLDPDEVYLRARSWQDAAELRVQVRSVSDMGGQVFIPMLVDGGGHYILAVANFANRTIKIYDSNSSRDVNIDTLRILGRIIPPIVRGEGAWAREFYNCVRQRNGADCGVSCFLNAVHSINHPNATHLANLPDLPAYLTAPPARQFERPLAKPMYWSSARAVILRLCSVQARDSIENAESSINQVGASITRVVDHVNSRYIAENRRGEAAVLAWVTAEIMAVNKSNNTLLEEAIVELSKLWFDEGHGSCVDNEWLKHSNTVRIQIDSIWKHRETL